MSRSEDVMWPGLIANCGGRLSTLINWKIHCVTRCHNCVTVTNRGSRRSLCVSPTQPQSISLLAEKEPGCNSRLPGSKITQSNSLRKPTKHNLILWSYLKVVQTEKALPLPFPLPFPFAVYPPSSDERRDLCLQKAKGGGECKKGSVRTAGIEPATYGAFPLITD